MRIRSSGMIVAWVFGIVLSPANHLSAVAMTLQEKAASGSISGVVVKDGEPVAGVGMLVTESTQGPSGPGNKTARTQSDKEGRFVFDGLERGSYHLEAYLPGAFVRSASPWRGPLLVAVGDGEAIEGLKIELESGGVITGKIVDTEGKVVAGEVVHVFRERRSEQGQASLVGISLHYESDDRGIYRVYGLSPGRYVIGSGDERIGFGFGGGLYERTFHGGSNNPEDAKRISVESGTEVRDVDIVVRRGEEGYTIVGNVLDAETRKPFTNVRMYCGPITNGQMTGFGGSGGVRDDGEFTIEGKIAGTYGIVAQASTTDTGSFYCDPVEVVVVDRDVTGVVVEMRRGASVSGVVVPLESEPGLSLSTIAPDSIVLQRRPDPGQSRRFAFGSGQLRLQPDRTFRATGLRNGEYTAMFSPYTPVKGFYVARVEVAGAPLVGPIRITEPAEITGVRIVIGRAGAVLRGRVVLRNGTYPFEQIGIRLRVAGTHQHVAFLRVDAKGNFQMESVAPGEYEASAIAAASGESSIESKPIAISIGAEGTVEVTIELDMKPSPPPGRSEP